LKVTRRAGDGRHRGEESKSKDNRERGKMEMSARKNLPWGTICQEGQENQGGECSRKIIWSTDEGKKGKKAFA